MTHEISVTLRRKNFIFSAAGNGSMGMNVSQTVGLAVATVAVVAVTWIAVDQDTPVAEKPGGQFAIEDVDGTAHLCSALIDVAIPGVSVGRNRLKGVFNFVENHLMCQGCFGTGCKSD